MEKCFRFLDEHIEVALATVEDTKPRIRVFQIMKRVNHTLFFATSPSKQVYKQLQSNPSLEILSSHGNVFVRVAGKADFAVDDQVQQQIYRDNLVLRRLYKSYQDLAYFSIEAAEVEYFDLTPTPPTVQYYDLRQQK